MKTEKELLECWNGTTEPVVSICTITYNHEKYIEKALKSFLMQETSFPFEILINDDASSDNNAKIIQRYEKEYPTIIKPIYQTENQKSKFKSGMNPRFNYPRACGIYIALCDGDDYWTDPLKLQKQVDFLALNLDYGLVFTDADVLYQATGKIIKDYDKTFKRKIPTGDVLEKLIDDNPYKTCTALFEAKFLKDYLGRKKPFFRIGDLPLWLHLASKKQVGYLAEATAVYRVGNVSASNFKQISGYKKFQKNQYKMRLYFSEIYHIPVNKQKQKKKYYSRIIKKSIEKKKYKELANHWRRLDIVFSFLLKEKIAKPLIRFSSNKN